MEIATRIRTRERERFPFYLTRLLLGMRRRCKLNGMEWDGAELEMHPDQKRSSYLSLDLSHFAWLLARSSLLGFIDVRFQFRTHWYTFASFRVQVQV